jgi:hypothetical protein
LGLRGRKWKKLCHENLDDLYVSPNITWVIQLSRIRMTNVAGMTEWRNAYRVLMEKDEERQQLGKSRCR